MKTISIKVNPYSNRTTILVDGEMPRDDSDLYYLIYKEQPLKNWVDDLPECISTTYNEMNFRVEFNGIESDYKMIKKELEGRKDLINLEYISFSNDANELKATIIEPKLLALLKEFSDKADIIQSGDFYNRFNSIYNDYNNFLNSTENIPADERVEKISSIINDLYDIDYNAILKEARIQKLDLEQIEKIINKQMAGINHSADNQSKIIANVCSDIYNNICIKYRLKDIEQKTKHSKARAQKALSGKKIIQTEKLCHEYNNIVNEISNIQDSVNDQLQDIISKKIEFVINDAEEEFNRRLKDIINVCEFNDVKLEFEYPELILSEVEYPRLNEDDFKDSDKDKMADNFKKAAIALGAASTALASPIGLALSGLLTTAAVSVKSTNVRKFYNELQESFCENADKNESLIKESWSEALNLFNDELTKLKNDLSDKYNLINDKELAKLNEKKNLILKKIEYFDSAINYFDSAPKYIKSIIQDEAGE